MNTIFQKKGGFLNVSVVDGGGDGNSSETVLTFDTIRSTGGQYMAVRVHKGTHSHEGPQETIIDDVEAVDVVLYGQIEFAELTEAMAEFADQMHPNRDIYIKKAARFAWAFVDDLYSEGPFKEEIDRFMAIASLALNTSQETMNLWSIEVDANGSRFMFIRHLGLSPVVMRKLRLSAELIGWEVEFEEKD